MHYTPWAYNGPVGRFMGHNEKLTGRRAPFLADPVQRLVGGSPLWRWWFYYSV